MSDPTNTDPIPHAHHLLLTDHEVEILNALLGHFSAAQRCDLAEIVEFGQIADLVLEKMGVDGFNALVTKIDLHYRTLECRNPNCDIHDYHTHQPK